MRSNIVNEITPLNKAIKKSHKIRETKLLNPNVIIYIFNRFLI